MNRSIFQTIKNRWLYNLTTIIIFYFLLNWNLNVNCFPTKNAPEVFLKELQYRGLIFKCSVEIPNEVVYQSIDNFLFNKNNNFNFNISKYYEIENNIATPCYKHSCYAHPNLFIGTFNNLHYNFQFSHKIYNLNFKGLTKEDMFFLPKNQYICNQLYIYDSIFKQQFLNFNDLIKNDLIIYKNENPDLIQKYLDMNNSKFNNIVNKALKI